MAMPKGSRMTSTTFTLNKIVDLCSQRPMTYAELADELQCSYKTAWLRTNELQKDGRIQVTGTRNGALQFGTINQTNIPHIPGPAGAVSPVVILNQVHYFKGKYISKLERFDRMFAYLFTGIFRTVAIIDTEDKFPAERHNEYRKILEQYREELTLRISQVNAILGNDKFWNQAGLQDMIKDPAYNSKKFLEAFEYANNAYNEWDRENPPQSHKA